MSDFETKFIMVLVVTIFIWTGGLAFIRTCTQSPCTEDASKPHLGVDSINMKDCTSRAKCIVFNLFKSRWQLHWDFYLLSGDFAYYVFNTTITNKILYFFFSISSCTAAALHWFLEEEALKRKRRRVGSSEWEMLKRKILMKNRTKKVSMKC